VLDGQVHVLVALLGRPGELVAPQIAALFEPAASITASTSSICSSSVGAPKNGSDRPEPRLSNVITLANWVSRAMTRSSDGSAQRYSTCDIHGGIQTRSSGPSPSTA
jgi:hypothetical protein